MPVTRLELCGVISALWLFLAGTVLCLGEAFPAGIAGLLSLYYGVECLKSRSG